MGGADGPDKDCGKTVRTINIFAMSRPREVSIQNLFQNVVYECSSCLWMLCLGNESEKAGRTPLTNFALVDGHPSRKAHPLKRDLIRSDSLHYTGQPPVVLIVTQKCVRLRSYRAMSSCMEGI